MKIGIYTSVLGEHVSGGILCIVETLNALVDQGHDCVCFVDDPPYRSDWLETKFPVRPSSEVDSFDGILVSPYSPTAEKVAFAKNAQDRFLWCHTNEALFCHNGSEWQDMARRSYHLPLKIFCTSTYLQILMEMTFNRYVIGTLVPPGIDINVFKPPSIIQQRDSVTVGILNRAGWVRGVDSATIALKMAQERNSKIRILPIGHVTDRNVMANHYRQMDIYLDMSRLAGSPVTVKEAMACGAISLCTKYGTTDFVLSDVNGYIIPVDDTNRVAELINLLADNYDRRVQLAANAAETVLKYNWTVIGMDFINAINEGIERGDELLKQRNWHIQR